jgi:hypothetical protein
MPLRQADHSSEGVLPSILRLRNLQWEAAKDSRATDDGALCTHLLLFAGHKCFVLFTKESANEHPASLTVLYRFIFILLGFVRTV